LGGSARDNKEGCGGDARADRAERVVCALRLRTRAVSRRRGGRPPGVSRRVLCYSFVRGSVLQFCLGPCSGLHPANAPPGALRARSQAHTAQPHYSRAQPLSAQHAQHARTHAHAHASHPAASPLRARAPR
jgi:hypothetical protein